MNIVNFRMIKTTNSTSVQNTKQSFDTRKESILKGSFVELMKTFPDKCLCNKITNPVNAANKNLMIYSDILIL